MAKTIPITYGEFYDYPRMVQFELDGRWYLLRSYFDEENDDYSDLYDVYLLPFRSQQEIQAKPDYWVHLDNAVHLGQLPVAQAGLDPTRRQSIDAALIGEWLLSRKAS